MQYSLIPACYFPSTVLFIDDSRNFLLNFVLQLDEWLAYRVFDSPFNALDHIHKKYCECATLDQRCLNKLTELKKYTDGQHINALLHSEIYNSQRFSEISVIVVDSAMSEMDGLEFCHKISHTPIKKILLTSKSDEKAASVAFNAGLIDCYIPKKDPNVADLITHSINELQQQYFQGMAKSIFHDLSLTLPACLQDKKFITFFKQLCDEQGIVEFYLVDDTGSFLLLDQDAQISFLTVKSDEERILYLELARQHGASSELINQLSKGEKIPAITQLADSSNQNWLTRLLPAHQLIANKTYWYSYSNELLLDINKEQLLSYHHHLEEIDAQELLLLSP